MSRFSDLPVSPDLSPDMQENDHPHKDKAHNQDSAGSYLGPGGRSRVETRSTAATLH